MRNFHWCYLKEYRTYLWSLALCICILEWSMLLGINVQQVVLFKDIIAADRLWFPSARVMRKLQHLVWYFSIVKWEFSCSIYAAFLWTYSHRLLGLNHGKLLSDVERVLATYQIWCRYIFCQLLLSTCKKDFSHML